MKITIYELLSLIKDGKPPKTITKYDKVLFYDEELKNYYDESGNHPLFTDDIALDLNNEIEIFFSTANALREYIGLPRIEEDNTNCELPQSDQSSSLFNKKIEKPQERELEIRIDKAIAILEQYEVRYRPGELYLKDILLNILQGKDR